MFLRNRPAKYKYYELCPIKLNNFFTLVVFHLTLTQLFCLLPCSRFRQYSYHWSYCFSSISYVVYLQHTNSSSSSAPLTTAFSANAFPLRYYTFNLQINTSFYSFPAGSRMRFKAATTNRPKLPEQPRRLILNTFRLFLMNSPPIPPKTLPT